ncbi:NAD(P)-dependent oxidoreductase [Promicromonospora sp. NPDC057138]|uniref:NAD(P)-dependent oxidoreductase n=1 Tax=Promicromonospora sp. NPDC057138 TaxID=3346031 RepID=UPI00363E88EF
MRLAVVAATGGVGRHVVDQALAAGHSVTALVRTPANVHQPVRAVAVDLAAPDPAVLRDALVDQDAVLSCLGPRGKGEYGIVEPGTIALTQAMREAGCRRIVAVSGSGVSTIPTPSRPNPPRREPGAGLYNRYFATPLGRRMLGAHFVDVAMMEHVLRTSGLDWTTVRPPYLSDGPVTGRYRTAVGHSVPGGVRLSRADTAHLMLRVLDDPTTIGQAVGAAN